VGSELLARKDELGLLLAREEGKTLAEAVAEVARAGQIFKFFAGEALRLAGEKLASVRPDVEVDVTREPVGVVGMIAPWNFPFAIPAWKIAPALAYGNTVVFKPAELVPACGWALAEILSRAACRPASSTWSTAAAGRWARRWSTAGWSTPSASPVRKPTARRCCRQAGARRQGAAGDGRQEPAGGAGRCRPRPRRRMRGAGRLLFHRPALHGFEPPHRGAKVHDAFVARLRQRMKDLKVGHALERGVDIGPVASRPSWNRTARPTWRSRAQQGAEHMCGGEALERATRGHYMSPALLLATPDEHASRARKSSARSPPCCAPTTTSTRWPWPTTRLTACARASAPLAQARHHFRRHAEAGMVMVNLPTAGVDYHVPFGGRKASSHGPREQGRHAAEFYTTVKTAYTYA
jgi:acyl-CoA reductase-like NAD-dependent aldehyde dehydrogenase